MTWTISEDDDDDDLNNKLEKSILARYKKHCSFINDFSQKAMSFIAVF